MHSSVLLFWRGIFISLCPSLALFKDVNTLQVSRKWWVKMKFALPCFVIMTVVAMKVMVFKENYLPCRLRELVPHTFSEPVGNARTRMSLVELEYVWWRNWLLAVPVNLLQELLKPQILGFIFFFITLWWNQMNFWWRYKIAIAFGWNKPCYPERDDK